MGSTVPHAGRPRSATEWTAKKRSFGNVDLGEGISDATRIARPNKTRGFLAIAQEHKRGPELDVERAAKGTAASVSNFDMAHLRMLREHRCKKRLRSTAVTAPGAPKFENGGSSKQIYICTLWFRCCKCVVHRHENEGRLTKQAKRRAAPKLAIMKPHTDPSG
jgi:hypothetical protein